MEFDRFLELIHLVILVVSLGYHVLRWLYGW
jgi:hypothetical protein